MRKHIYTVAVLAVVFLVLNRVHPGLYYTAVGMALALGVLKAVFDRSDRQAARRDHPAGKETPLDAEAGIDWDAELRALTGKQIVEDYDWDAEINRLLEHPIGGGMELKKEDDGLYLFTFRVDERGYYVALTIAGKEWAERGYPMDVDQDRLRIHAPDAEEAFQYMTLRAVAQLARAMAEAGRDEAVKQYERKEGR